MFIRVFEALVICYARTSNQRIHLVLFARIKHKMTGVMPPDLI